MSSRSAGEGGQPTIEQAFGRVLRDLRHERGMSQEALAEAANLHVTHISRLENGHQGPTLAAVFALARALNILPADLVRRVDAATPRLSTRPSQCQGNT